MELKFKKGIAKKNYALRKCRCGAMVFRKKTQINPTCFKCRMKKQSEHAIERRKRKHKVVSAKVS